MKQILLLTAAVALSLSAATAHAQPDTREVEQPVIYGEDDRMDVADHPSAELRALADGAVVTLISRAGMRYQSGSFQVGGSTLRTAQNLCPGERFSEQPAAGFCSGTLVGQDLVLTAGHCIGGEASCRTTVVAFDYQWEGNGLGPMNEDDVFNCRRVVARAESSNPTLDYAIIQLDRPVPGRIPAAMRDVRTSIRVGDAFAIIGSPSGIPQKIDDGGSVRETGDSTVFVGTPDSFGGNSGSGIFELGSLDLIGILISGEQDYVSDGSCQRVNMCSETGCQGENMLHAGVALDALCGAEPNAEPCGTPSCGDGICAGSEVDSCAADCTVAPVCGNSWCEGDEWEGCPQDCEVQIPADWTCDPTYYGTLDGCDCDCGTLDPDCEAGQEVLNCGFGAVCNADGTCSSGGGLGGALCDAATTPLGSRNRALMLLLAFGGLLFARRVRA